MRAGFDRSTGSIIKAMARCLILYSGILWACAYLYSSPARASETRVIYPDREGILENETYPFSLLELALKKSGKPFLLVPSRLPMNDARARIELSKKRISIAWFGTSIEFERQFLAVPFPITQGILGHRLLIIHRDDQQVFSAVRTLDDLKAFTAGQGMGWSDVNILRHAGLMVKTDMMDDLFRMINRKQIIDYFPLGANEVFDFAAHNKTQFPNLAVEKTLVLVYPFDFFFFVNTDDRHLHDIVHKGLLKAYADGSFNHLFTTHPNHSGFLKKAELAHRRRINISNPVLSQKSRELLKRYAYTSKSN